MRRASTLLVPLLLWVPAGCGADEPAPAPTSTAATSGDCAGGSVILRQGVPTDLPGGGSAGIGQVFEDEDPVRANLALGGAGNGESGRDLVVGDTFTVQGAGYRVVGICPDKVALEPTG